MVESFIFARPRGNWQADCQYALDFPEAIQRIVSQHQRTYFKRHPYASDDEKVVKQMLQSESVGLTDENIYRLLCHDHIQGLGRVLGWPQ